MSSEPKTKKRGQDLPGPDWFTYHPFIVWLRNKPNTLRWEVIRFCLALVIITPIGGLVGAGAVFAGLAVLALYGLAFLYGLARM